MLKSFMYFLLFVFVFVLGMQTATNTPWKKQNDEQVESTPTFNANEERMAYNQSDFIEVAPNSDYDIEDREEHFSNKFVTILENIVSGFYNMILNILYRVVEVFF